MRTALTFSSRVGEGFAYRLFSHGRRRSARCSGHRTASSLLLTARGHDFSSVAQNSAAPDRLAREALSGLERVSKRNVRAA